MSSFTNDITDQYLTKIYDDLQREQMTLMNSLKSNTDDNTKERDITRQISLINTINLGVMRLKNARKKSAPN